MNNNKNKIYSGKYLDKIAFPLGGLGAGMVCVQGTGAITNMSVRHLPNLGVLSVEQVIFASLCVKNKKGNVARVLEGPVPTWKIMGTRDSHSGAWRQSWGLPRCESAEFEERFPFAVIRMRDEALAVEIEVTAWSPFTPGETDDSCMPVAALEYRFRSLLKEPVEAVFGFHSQNWMPGGIPGKEVQLLAKDGFMLQSQGSKERPEDKGAFCVACDAANVVVNPTWFRSGLWDTRSILWKEIVAGDMAVRDLAEAKTPSGGGSVYAPLNLEPGVWSESARVRMAWHVPQSSLRVHPDDKTNVDDPTGRKKEKYKPWYATQFKDVKAVDEWWRTNYIDLRDRSLQFGDCLRESTLPDEVIEAISANLTILKSPTVLRQADGRFWAWEGCCDDTGSCYGSCTHVWNYAQALAHLFPDLERGLRVTEFQDNQDVKGHQNFRAALPIGPAMDHDSHAAADGQLGGIIKVYRDWRISGDTEWLRQLWPQIKNSLNYCIETWDPEHRGALFEPHHNTYDIEFWGPNGMCTSIYLAALRAGILMATEFGEDTSLWETLYTAGRQYLETELYNGEYFFQKVIWKGLRAGDPGKSNSMWDSGYSKEALDLLEKEGPKHQYGKGCLSDGIIGSWFAACAGLEDIVDSKKVLSHLKSVHQYNLNHDFRTHVNPQRPGFALGEDGGLLLCSWPKGGELSLPFIYSQEVWTGIEYQVASHLIMLGAIDEGLEIVRMTRSRYDGHVRNPFDEYECGHWYARALASYALLQAFSGARYDGLTKTLHLSPPKKGDYACFFATEGGYGLVGIREGEPFVDVRHGQIDVQNIEYLTADTKYSIVDI
jgi:uncharacterized protein (DUF608 family)